MRFETGVLLGEGGMGRVLKLWDPDLERYAAVKVLRTDDPDAAERMQREARAQARVEHPNVGRIYEVGEHHGRPCITMQLIDGRPLDEAVADLRLERRIALMVPVVRAVQAAHAAGLVHRDLKPSNILVEGREDGELVPYVVDFGIAREAAGTGLTLSGQIVGTPGYMSPEQARGEVRSIDRRSDVFSLGVLLYELAADRHPFDAGSAMGTLMRILDEEPPPLSRVAPHVPRDLRVVIERCLEKNRDRRYPSAAALGDDLERYLAGEPVTARAVSRLERLRRRVRRHPVASGLVAAALLLAALGAGFGLATWWRAGEQARAAEAFGRRVERIENVLRLGHVSPLHELAAEHALVEEELAAIRAALAAGGDSIRGPALYALGRGALSLGRLEEARRLLEEAVALGYDASRVRLALGRAFLGLLSRSLAEAEQQASAEQRREARQRAVAAYGEPARRLLASPALVGAGWDRAERRLLRGQLALAEGNAAAARELGIAAAESVSWLYEGSLLAAEVDLREAARRLDVAPSEEVAERLARARALLAETAERAPSDPEVYVALCRAWRLELDRRFAAATAPTAEFERGMAHCDAALVADPRHPAALSTRAHLASRYGRWLSANGQDPAQPLHLAEESARSLLELDAERPLGFVHLGNVLVTRANWAREQGDEEAKRRLLRRAIGQFERAARLGNDPLLYVSLGQAWWRLGQSSWGGDWEAAFAAGVAAFEQGLELGTGSVPDLRAGLCSVHNEWGYLATQQGREPGDHLELAIAECRAALAVDPRHATALNGLATGYWGLAEERRARGEDPREDLVAAARGFADLLARQPGHLAGHVNRGTVLLQLAEQRLERGGEVDGILAEAAEHAEAIREVYPIDYHYHQTRLHLVRARQAGAAGLGDEAAAAFAGARRSAEDLLAGWPGLPTNHVLAAAVDRHAASWRLARGERELALRRANEAAGRADAAVALAADLAEGWSEKALATAVAARATRDAAAAERHWRDAREAALQARELALGPRPELSELLTPSAEGEPQR